MVSRILYLDLKDWIDLTRGRLRRPRFERQTIAYEALCAAVAAGDVVVPLATAHYMELANINDPAQRGELALTMAEVSRFVTLTAREILMEHELRMAMAHEFQRPYAEPAPPTLGHGVAHAFGMSGTMRLRGPADKLETLAATSGEEMIAKLEKLAGFGWRYRADIDTMTPLERLQDAVDQAAQYSALRGPSDDDLAHLGEHGYDPSKARQVIENIRKREADLATILEQDPVSAEKLADYILVRAWYWDLQEGWDGALADVGCPGLTIEEIGKERISRIVADVPIIAVESAVRQRRFRHGLYKWEPNDVYDLSFIGQAVVYCDALTTDKDMRAHLMLQKIDRRYRVAALRDLDQMVAWLTGGAKD